MVGKLFPMKNKGISFFSRPLFNSSIEETSTRLDWVIFISKTTVLFSKNKNKDVRQRAYLFLQVQGYVFAIMVESWSIISVFFASERLLVKSLSGSKVRFVSRVFRTKIEPWGKGLLFSTLSLRKHHTLTYRRFGHLAWWWYWNTIAFEDLNENSRSLSHINNNTKNY